MKNNKSLEHLNVLLRIFFVSGVFQNFDVDFWPLLKEEKVLAPKQFCRKKNFSSKFYFLSSILIYKLSASRITENSSHCYTLSYRGKSRIFIIRGRFPFQQGFRRGQKYQKKDQGIKTRYLITEERLTLSSMPTNQG